jgi:hypothetical protein
MSFGPLGAKRSRDYCLRRRGHPRILSTQRSGMMEINRERTVLVLFHQPNRHAPMKSRATRVAQKSSAPRSDAANAVEGALRSTFTSMVVDELREQTGYNPRQRLITAQRLMLVVVEAFLMEQTLGFTALRAIFVRRFGFIRPCPFGNASSRLRRPPSSVQRLSAWLPR